MKENLRLAQGHDCKQDPLSSYLGAAERTDVSGQSGRELSGLDTS